MRSFEIAAVCGIILTAAAGINADKCFSDNACAGLVKTVPVTPSENGKGKEQESIPMFFSCEKAAAGTKDASGNSCEKKITDCCMGASKPGDCVGVGLADVFGRWAEGRFCIACSKATDAPEVKRMSGRPFEVCGPEGGWHVVNKCRFNGPDFCLPRGTFAARKKGADDNKYHVCLNDLTTSVEANPKSSYFAGQGIREARSWETTCYTKSRDAIQSVRKCKFTYEGKSLCVQQGFVFAVPGDDQKYAAFVCPAKASVGVRLSKSEHAAQTSKLGKSLQNAGSDANFEENPLAQCYGM